MLDMSRHKLKKIISIVLMMGLTLQSVVFAKTQRINEGEVDEPVSERDSNISESVIIHKNEYEEYNQVL